MARDLHMARVLVAFENCVASSFEGSTGSVDPVPRTSESMWPRSYHVVPVFIVIVMSYFLSLRYLKPGQARQGRCGEVATPHARSRAPIHGGLISRIESYV